jgi:hypothetical protein
MDIPVEFLALCEFAEEMGVKLIARAYKPEAIEATACQAVECENSVGVETVAS